MLRIPWVARKTNDDVLREVNIVRELLKTIESKKILENLGNVLREERYNIPQIILN